MKTKLPLTHRTASKESWWRTRDCLWARSAGLTRQLSYPKARLWANSNRRWKQPFRQQDFTFLTCGLFAGGWRSSLERSCKTRSAERSQSWDFCLPAAGLAVSLSTGAVSPAGKQHRTHHPLPPPSVWLFSPAHSGPIWVQRQTLAGRREKSIRSGSGGKSKYSSDCHWSRDCMCFWWGKELFFKTKQNKTHTHTTKLWGVGGGGSTPDRSLDLLGSEVN